MTGLLQAFFFAVLSVSFVGEIKRPALELDGPRLYGLVSDQSGKENWWGRWDFLPQAQDKLTIDLRSSSRPSIYLLACQGVVRNIKSSQTVLRPSSPKGFRRRLRLCRDKSTWQSSFITAFRTKTGKEGGTPFAQLRTGFRRRWQPAAQLLRTGTTDLRSRLARHSPLQWAKAGSRPCDVIYWPSAAGFET